MKKAKGIPYEEKLMNALRKLPNPIIDKRHSLLIYIFDDRARSNESRFEHIVSDRHELCINDIRRIPRAIKRCIFRKDNERDDSFSLYLRRHGSNSKEYIKIAIKLMSDDKHKAFVRTIFITKNLK